MAMGDARLKASPFRQFIVGPFVPEDERQRSHERAVAVIEFAAWPRIQRRDSGAKRPNRRVGRNADVEDVALYRQIALFAPAHEPSPEIRRIESSAGEKRVEKTESLRSVIRPGSRSDSRMGARKGGGRIVLDLFMRRDLFRPVKFVGDAQRIADQQPVQPSLYPLLS
jgi:hypothetical protein